jgi:hypothetical protein
MKNVVRHPLVAATFFFSALAVSAGARADTIPPPMPTFTSLVPFACHRLDINWSTEYDSGSGLAYYNLYRRRADGTILWLGRVTGDVSPYIRARRRMIWYMDDTNFQVGLEAVDRAGNSSAIAWSSTVVMPLPSTTMCQDVYRPSLPTGLTAAITGGTCAVVNLTWNNDASDAGFVTSGVKGYNVYRDDEWLYFKTPLPVSGPLVQEDRFGLVPGQTYTYSIKTIDNAGFESASATSVSIAIPADCGHHAPRGDRSIDVIGVRFPDQTAAPLYTMAQIENKLFATIADPREGTSARSFFLEASYGRATFHKQTVSSGYYTLPHPTTYMPYHCVMSVTGEVGHCDTNAIIQDALAVSGLVRTGNILMVLSSGSTDSDHGATFLRTNPNRETLDVFLQTVVHELSHSFGVEHSADWECPGYFAAGPDVTDLQFGSDIPAETGDGYSVLGVANLRHYPAFTKRLMAFLSPSATNTVTVDGTYTIGRLEDTMGSTVKELSLGTVEDYSSNFTKGPLYSVEYRTRTGYDGNKTAGGGSAPFDGVLVHLVPHRFHGAEANTYLVAKLLPASGANIFYDPVTELGVKLNSTDGLNANVSVCGIHGAVCPPEYAASIPPWP